MTGWEGYPSWARELATLVPACSHFLLSGNVADLYFVPRGTGKDREGRSVPWIISDVLAQRGIGTVVTYEVTEGAGTIPTGPEGASRAAELLGGDLSELAPPERLRSLADLIRRVSSAPEPVALVINSASRLVRDVSHLSDEEFDFYRRVDRLARSATPVRGSVPLQYNPVVWILDHERDVPAWFAVGNVGLRSIVLPYPHSGERRELAERLVPTLTGTGTEDLGSAVRVLTEQTAGLSLAALVRTIAIARDQGLGPDRVEDAARSYRVGVSDNPWRASYLVDRLRAELAALESSEGTDGGTRSVLASRVLGQEVAIRKSLDILVRSATGLTAAQAGASATRPRGVLFFAGPTGVGKTELAKALTKLLFDDERFYIRFDMSEFSAEHAADRLIGAPPGYQGFDAGGELTNAIRQRPFSLVLFDEVEKAHPRILDKFLQVLDDGRLTDGRGETVFFTESVIVFTSNLGIYTEVDEMNDFGIPVRRRRPTVDRSTVTYAEMAGRVEQSIRDYFTLQLGRPELLNRIGDNIVVFDYIGKDIGARILDAMVANVTARARQEHQVDIEIDGQSVDRLREACLGDDILLLGGRGVGSALETALVNPLANWIFLESPKPGSKVRLGINQVGEEWKATTARS